MKRVILLSSILLPFLAFAQITGRVVTGSGVNNGIPFATVVIKNTSIGTQADSLGNFSISGIENFPVTLIATFAGFEPEEKIVRENNTTNIIIRLQALFQKDTIVVTSRRRREQL